MQKDETVGRVLLASLHQAIAEVLPARLEFYETWLKPSDLHQQTIGLSAFLAVLSFLHREGNAYDIVMARAGHYAAMWSFEEIGGMRRALVRALPHGMRVRSTSRLMRERLRRSYPDSQIEIAWRGSTLFVDLQGSPFCAAPEPADHSVCGFYAGAIVAFFRLFNLDAAVRVSRCRASGAKSCLLLVLIDSTHAVAGARTSTLGLASAPPGQRVPEAATETVTQMRAAVTMSVEVESVAAPEPIETPEPEPKVERPEAATKAPPAEGGPEGEAAMAPTPVPVAPAPAAPVERALVPEPAPAVQSEAAPARTEVTEPAPPAEAEPAPPVVLTEPAPMPEAHAGVAPVPAGQAEAAPTPVAQAEAAPAEPERTEPAQMDRAEIEALWAHIVAKEPARSEPKEPELEPEPEKAAPPPEQEHDPEAAWRRL